MTALAAYAWIPDGLPLWETIGERALSDPDQRQAAIRLLREAV